MPAVALFVLLTLLALPGRAHAYIDPSAGSLLLQLILGGIAGLMVAVRLYWKRLTGLLGRRQASPEERDQAR